MWRAPILLGARDHGGGKRRVTPPQSPLEGQEHHQSVSVTMAVGPGRFDQLLDLVDGQVLACPKVSVFGSARRDCSILVAGATRRRRGLAMRNPPLRLPHCSIHRHYLNSREAQGDRS
jgi:hypothetical protein